MIQILGILFGHLKFNSDTGKFLNSDGRIVEQ